MIIYEIPEPPIPLQRHRHSGKRCYDPQKKEKERIQWDLKNRVESFCAATEPFKLTVEYHMPIPKSYSLKKAKELVRKPHTKKPDLSNLIKFTEDVFNGMLWEDDSLICEISARKFYSEKPKTIFKIENVSNQS